MSKGLEKNQVLLEKFILKVNLKLKMNIALDLLHSSLKGGSQRF
jgi:hypothetical protein